MLYLEGVVFIILRPIFYLIMYLCGDVSKVGYTDPESVNMPVNTH